MDKQIMMDKALRLLDALPPKPSIYHELRRLRKLIQGRAVFNDILQNEIAHSLWTEAQRHRFPLGDIFNVAKAGVVAYANFTLLPNEDELENEYGQAINDWNSLDGEPATTAYFIAHEAHETLRYLREQVDKVDECLRLIPHLYEFPQR